MWTVPYSGRDLGLPKKELAEQQHSLSSAFCLWIPRDQLLPVPGGISFPSRHSVMAITQVPNIVSKIPQP